MQPLRGDEQVHAAVVGGDREAALGPERRLILDAGLVVALDPDVRLHAWVAVRDPHVAKDVPPIVELRRGGIERLFHVGHRGKRLVVHGDAIGSASGELGCLRGDDGDGLAVVANAIGREHRLVGELEPVGRLPRHVLCREHGDDTGCGERVRDVDRADARMGVRAPERVSPEHAFVPEVAPIGERPANLGDAVDAAHGLADAAAHALLGSPAHRSAPAIRRATRWPSSAIASWFAVASRPSRTTTRPSTITSRADRGRQSASAATGSSPAPAKARPSTPKSATSARFPGSSEPRSPARPRHSAPPRVAIRRASRAVSAAGSPAARATSMA